MIHGLTSKPKICAINLQELRIKFVLRLQVIKHTGQFLITVHRADHQQNEEGFFLPCVCLQRISVADTFEMGSWYFLDVSKSAFYFPVTSRLFHLKNLTVTEKSTLIPLPPPSFPHRKVNRAGVVMSGGQGSGLEEPGEPSAPP